VVGVISNHAVQLPLSFSSRTKMAYFARLSGKEFRSWWSEQSFEEVYYSNFYRHCQRFMHRNLVPSQVDEKENVKAPKELMQN